MRKNSIALLALLSCAGAAAAAPRESVTFTAVPSQEVLGDPANAVREATFAGGYQVVGIQVTGALRKIEALTYVSEARIEVTPPSGPPIIAQLSAIEEFSGTFAVNSAIVFAAAPITDTAGTWTFRFFESSVDSETDADSIWDTVTITLQDETPGVATKVGTAYGEAEPNDRTYFANNVTGMLPGDSIVGITTGTGSLDAGAGTSDNFRVALAARPLGIYRNRLALTTTGAAGHIGTIRGLTQSGGVIAARSDATIQTSSTATTPARFNQWYGFGKQEELYYRVTGSSSTTAAYAATLTSTPVTPVVVASSLVAGPVTISRGTGNTTNVDMLLYDGNLDPVPGGLNQGNNTLTTSLGVGTYYLFVANANTADSRASTANDSARSGSVLDFPNAITNSGVITISNLNMNFTSSAGTVSATGSKPGPFDVAVYQFTTTAPTSPGAILLSSGSGSVSRLPAPVGRVFYSARITTTIIPGQSPSSTGLTATVNLSGIGGAAAAQLFDDGTNGDLTAGDGIYSLEIDATSIPSGTYALPLTASDAQSRVSTGTFTLTLSTGSIIDLGVLPTSATPVSTSINVTPGGVQWFKLTTATDSVARGSFLDLYTLPVAGSPIFDTEIGVYRADGTLVTSDDDDGEGSHAALSFGSTLPIRPLPAPSGFNPPGAPGNGRDGALPAGTYYVATGQSNVQFSSTSFGVPPTSGISTGAIRLVAVSSGDPTNPSGTGVAVPGIVDNTGVAASTLRFTLLPGVNPVTTDHVVTVNAAAIGAGTVTLRDDGFPPDLNADDNIFSGSVSAASGAAIGQFNLPVSITTSDARVGVGSINLAVREPIGACCVGSTASVLPLSSCVAAGGTFLGEGSSAVGTGTVYASTDDLPVFIPDFGVAEAPIIRTLTITDPATITSLAVRIGLSHPAVGDLIGTLSNGTTSVVLFSRTGAASLNGTYTFSDQATAVFGVGNGSLPSGEYKTAGVGSGSLSAFAGSPAAGTWTLTVADGSAIATGLLLSFEIDVNPTPCPTAPRCLADVAGGGDNGNQPDGTVDGSDFIGFINSFGIGDASVDVAADVAGGGANGDQPDGTIDGSDFIAFINAFAAGC